MMLVQVKKMCEEEDGGRWWQLKGRGEGIKRVVQEQQK
jgi:hypothetical protein